MKRMRISVLTPNSPPRTMNLSIIAYTFNADLNCVDCTRNAYEAGDLSATRAFERDGNGLPESMTDSEDNPVHPVFSTDELAPNTSCGCCMFPVN